MFRGLIALIVLMAGSVVTAQPATRPVSRELRLHDYEMARVGGWLPKEETARPAAEVLAEFLKEDDRRMLDGLVEILRNKILSGDQVQELIAAAEKEPAEGKRIYLWVALYHAQSSVARQYLEKTLTAATDTGMAIQFLESLRSFRASEAPLLTSLYEHHPSELVQDEIVRFATTLRRNPGGMHEESVYGEMPARAVLLGWLLRHARTPQHRGRVVSSYYQMAGFGPTAIQELRDYFEQEPSAEARKIAYQALLRGFSGEEILRTLLLREKDTEVQLAGLKAYRDATAPRAEFTPNPERLMAAPDNVVRILREALASDLAPAVKTEVQTLIDAYRKHAVMLAIAEQQRRVDQDVYARADYYESLPSDARARRLETLQRDSVVNIDGVVRSLTQRYGSLPEEQELRTKLAPLQTQQREAVEALLRKLGAATQPADAPKRQP
jgi:hypothetical protein